MKLVTAGGRDDFMKMAENPGTFGADLDQRLTVRMPVKAGTHTLWATTVLKSHASRDDLIKPFLRTTVDGLDIMGDPSVDRLTVEGPFAPTGAGDTPSRRKIFVCKPAGLQAEEVRHAPARSCRTSGRQAYRKPIDKATSRHADGLLRSAGANTTAASIAGSNPRCSSFWRVRSFCSVSNPILPIWRGQNSVLPAGRSGAGVAPVVLPVEQHARTTSC